MNPNQEKRKTSSTSPLGRAKKRASSVTPLDGSDHIALSRSPRCSSIPFDLVLESNSVKWGRMDSNFRCRWTNFQFILLTYNCISTPMSLWVMSETNFGMVVMDIVVDIAFVVDTVLSFQFEYIDEQSLEVVSDKEKIKEHYLKSHEFKVGVLSTLSILFSVILLAFDANNPVFIQFDLLRLIRLYLFKDVIMFMKHQAVRKHGSVNESLFRMGIIFFATIQSIIVGGCFYFYIACPGKHECKANSWVNADSLTGASLTSRFLRAMHFMTQTLITIGYGDAVIPVSAGEVAFTCFFIIIGLFLYSLILANMTSVLANFDVVGMRFRNEIELIKSYLGMRAIPAEQRRDVQCFFDYCYAKQGGMLEADIVERLPDQLTKEIVLNYQQYVEKIPFFNPEYRSKAFLQAITAKLTVRMYTPGTVVVEPLSYLKEILILKLGRLEVLAPSQRNCLWAMVPGDYIGDYQVLFGGPFEWQVMALTVSDVLVLGRVAIHEVLNTRRFSSVRARNDRGVDQTLNYHRDHHEKLVHLQKSIGNKSGILGSRNDMDRAVLLKRQATMAPKTMQEFQGQYHIITPDSRFHLFWDVACILLSLYFAFQVPFRLILHWNRSTGENKFFFPMDLVVDYMGDVFFIVDAVLNARFFALQDFNSANLMITDKNEIMRQYFWSFRSKIDAISCFPYELAGPLIGYFIQFRLLHSLRLLLLPVYLSNFSLHLEKVKGVEISTTKLTVVKMVLATLIATHWTSCFWSLVHSDGKDLLEAWYWTFTTFTTVGYGDITPVSLQGTIFTIVVGGLGAVFWAGIIANITNFVQSIEISDTNPGHRRKALARFLMKQKVLSEDARSAQREKMDKFFDFLERDYHGIDEPLFLKKALPEHLREQIIWNLTKDLLENCQMFRDMSDSVRFSVAQLLEQQFYPMDSIICRFKPAVLGMSFIKHGNVTIHEQTAEGGKRVLYEGMYFYRQALFQEWDSNPYQIKAQTDVEIFFLRRAAFQQMLNEQPQMKKNLQTKKSLDINHRAAPQISCLSNKEKHFAFNKHNSMYNKSNRKMTCQDSSTDLYKKLAKKPRFLLNPGDDKAYIWNAVVLFFTIFNWVGIPYRIGFGFGRDWDYYTLAVGYLGDVMFLMDIFFHGFLLSFQKVGEIETNRKKIFERYYRSYRIWIHILALLPLEALFGFVRSAHLSPDQVLSFFRLNRLFRVMDFTELVPALQKWLLTRFGMHNNTMRVIKLMSVVALSAHVFGCIFFFLAAYHWYWLSDCETWAGGNGLIAGCNQLLGDCEGGECDVEISVQYVYSLYWAMATLTTVGYGDISAVSSTEIVFGIFALIMGTLIFTLAVAYLTDIITQMDVTQTLYKNQVDRFNLYCKLMELPGPLVGQIEKYSRQLWLEYQGVPPQQLLNYMPRNLRRDLGNGMVGGYLEKTFFFKDHPQLVPEVAGVLNLELCMSDQKIFTKGEPAEVLFLLMTGSVDLINPDNGTRYTTLEKCVIAEAEFFSRDIHVCDGVCKTQSQMFMLDFEDFWEFLNDYNMHNAFYNCVKKNTDKLESMSSKVLIKKLQENLGKGKLQKMMDTTREGSSNELIFEPGSKFKRVWNLVALMVVMYYTCTIPVGIAFVYKIQVWQVCLDAVLDAFFYVDIYMNLRHFAVEVEGLILRKREDFSRRYSRLGGRMLLDVLSSLPLSLIMYLAGLGRSSPEIFGLFRLPQLFRTKRMVFYGTTTVQWLQEITNISIRTKVARILRMFLSILILTHYVSCAYLFLGRTEIAAGVDNWMEANAIADADKGTSYLISFYWALYTLTTVGYGNIAVISVADHVFALVSMVLGSILFDAGMVAVLTSIIEDSDYEAGTYQRLLKCTEKYMVKSNFDDALALVVFKFYEYTKKHQANTIEKQVHSELSFCLRRTVNRFLCIDHLTRSKVFTNFDEGCLNALAFKMKPCIGLPGEVLLDSSMPSEELYILQEGDCRLSQKGSLDGSRFHLLPRGSLICSLKEISLEGLGMCGSQYRIRLVDASKMQEYDSSLCERVVEFQFLGGSFRSSTKQPTSTVIWDEEYTINCRKDDIIQASVYDVLIDDGRQSLLGKASIPAAYSKRAQEASEKEEDPPLAPPISVPLLSRQGEECGSLRLHLTPVEEPQEDKGKLIACRTFCHLYKLDFEEIVRIVQYKQNLSLAISNRLPARKTAMEYLPILKLPKAFAREMNELQYSILSNEDEVEESVIRKFSAGLSKKISKVARRMSMSGAGKMNLSISIPRRQSISKSMNGKSPSLRMKLQSNTPGTPQSLGSTKSMMQRRSPLGIFSQRISRSNSRRVSQTPLSKSENQASGCSLSLRSSCSTVCSKDSKVAPSHIQQEEVRELLHAASSDKMIDSLHLQGVGKNNQSERMDSAMLDSSIPLLSNNSDESLSDQKPDESGGKEEEIRLPSDFVPILSQSVSPSYLKATSKVKLSPLKTLRKINSQDLIDFDMPPESKQARDDLCALDTLGTQVCETVTSMPMTNQKLFAQNAPSFSNNKPARPPIFIAQTNTGSLRSRLSTNSTASEVGSQSMADIEVSSPLHFPDQRNQMRSVCSSISSIEDCSMDAIAPVPLPPKVDYS